MRDKAAMRLFWNETISDLATEILELMQQKSPCTEASIAAAELAATLIAIQGLRGKVAVA